MLLASAGGLILADIVGFNAVYFVMALVMARLHRRDARSPGAGRQRPPRTLAESFIGPFVEFFTRRDAREGAARARRSS